MQYPDYKRNFEQYDYAPTQQPERPERNWGGYRPNSGRKHHWSKSDYPLKSLNLPGPLRQKIKELRDSGVPVEDIMFRLDR